MAGRRPKPAAMHRLNGNPSMLRKGEIDGSENPEPETALPEMPKGLPKAAKREWRQITPLLLANGLLTRVDGRSLAEYCRWCAIAERAQKELDEKGYTFTTKFQDKDDNIIDGDIKANPSFSQLAQASKMMKSYLIEFGLTPASRRNLKISKPAENAMDAFLSRGARPSAGPTLLTPVKPEDMTADDESVVTPAAEKSSEN